MSYSGLFYNDSCPPPPGVDVDGYYSAREYDQRDRDRARRYEHRTDHRSERSSRYSYEESEPRDDSFSRRSRFEGRKSSSYSGEDVEERRSYRDRSRERERYDRSRERDRPSRDRDHARDHESRWEREEETRRREREDVHRRDREREREHEHERPRDEGREEIPNNTIMVRNVGPTVTEADIKNELARYGLLAKDIRLMRKKEANRGFAFVEFNLLSEAVRWKELTQSLIFFDGQCRSTLHYSIPKETMSLDRGYGKAADWACSKCGVNNFRKRDTCFKCNSQRDDLEGFGKGDGQDEISSYPSNTLLFRNLDVLTTEERVLSMLGQLTMLPIKKLKVAKDSLTNISKGFAFVELHSTSEATQLHDLLLSMGGNFYVDGRQVTVSYARRSLSSMHGSASVNAAIVALAASQWTNQASDYTSSTPASQSYAKPVAQSNNLNTSSVNTVVVDGMTYQRYPIPDMSSYTYDQNSGYHYDASTGLYYDSNSQYYYNSESQQYLYWSNEHQTYLPASSSSSNTPAAAPDSSKKDVALSAEVLSAATLSATPKLIVNEPPVKKEPEAQPTKVVKQDKVKIAKKIAKEMEKWAKTLNQKKENAKTGFVALAAPILNVMESNQVSSADAGFSILEKKSSIQERNMLISEEVFSDNMESDKPALVAEYGGESDSEPEPEIHGDGEGNMAFELLKAEEYKLTDWSKMACLMCKRQFPNQESLLRHQELSELHKQNLDVLKLTKIASLQTEDLDTSYRDRAKERRRKFGQPDAPPPNKLKNKFMKGREEQVNQAEQPTKDGIGADNIGNKMLKAMGWSEGQGLGKAGQGMSGIIEVQQRSKTAGLGMKGSTYGVTAGDSYKEAVKKAMQARYKEVSDG